MRNINKENREQSTGLIEISGFQMATEHSKWPDGSLQHNQHCVISLLYLCYITIILCYITITILDYPYPLFTYIFILLLFQGHLDDTFASYFHGWKES